MPKRVAAHRVRERYTSKAYRAYVEAWNRLALIENMAAGLINMSNREGFMARFLRRPGTPKPPPKPRVVADIPPLRPYHRNSHYVIPKGWPKPFLSKVR